MRKKSRRRRRRRWCGTWRKLYQRDWVIGYGTGRDESVPDVVRLERENAALAVELQNVQTSFDRYREEVKYWIRQTLGPGLHAALDSMMGVLDERAHRLMDDRDPTNDWGPMEMDLLEGLDDGLDVNLFPDFPPVERPEDAPPPYSEHPPSHF
ncbi:hypothetical protein HOLleu_02323 [Holothuria leucospilota]|uniref:Uncharacterized protein n=1 Tax=Holothuria leucospilota TaxID=206669 RepID=A0A9Q1CRG9_HOLLE|nr:hypothetical protein HOLleu_02323 [Holothuria leucospilota]